MEEWHEIYDHSLSRSDRHSIASAQKSSGKQCFMREQEAYEYPIWFSCQHKSYPLQYSVDIAVRVYDLPSVNELTANT